MPNKNQIISGVIVGVLAMLVYDKFVKGKFV